MIARWRRFHRAALLGTTLAAAACSKPKDDVVVAPDGSGGPATTGSGAPIELAPVDHPSQLLPRGTMLAQRWLLRLHGSWRRTGHEDEPVGNPTVELRAAG